MEYMRSPTGEKILTANMVKGVFDAQRGNLLVGGYTGNLS